MSKNVTLPDNFFDHFSSPRDAFVMFYIMCKTKDGVFDTTIKSMCEDLECKPHFLRNIIDGLKASKFIDVSQSGKSRAINRAKVITRITVCKSDGHTHNETSVGQRSGQRSGKGRAKVGQQIKPESEGIDFDRFKDYFNLKMNSHAICPIRLMTDKRRETVGARAREFGKQSVADMICRAADSDFLNGKNKNAWVADFDWLFRPNNFPKVLEGSYDNKNIIENGNTTGIESDKAKRLAGYAEVARKFRDYGSEENDEDGLSE